MDALFIAIYVLLVGSVSVYSEVSTLPSQSTGYLLDPKIVDYTTIDFEATKSRARAMPKPKPVQKNATKGMHNYVHTMYILMTGCINYGLIAQALKLTS